MIVGKGTPPSLVDRFRSGVDCLTAPTSTQGNVMFGSRNLVGIYLNDHLAGATLGAQLARRLADSHPDWPSAADLTRIAAEVAEDRTALLEMMAALGVPVVRVKVYAGWAAERVGRLKLNGRLLNPSPLSGLVEVEAVELGVQGKAAGWRALRVVAEHDHRLDVTALDALLARARAQSDTLERIRARTVSELFGSP